MARFSKTLFMLEGTIDQTFTHVWRKHNFQNPTIVKSKAWVEEGEGVETIPEIRWWWTIARESWHRNNNNNPTLIKNETFFLQLLLLLNFQKPPIISSTTTIPIQQSTKLPTLASSILFNSSQFLLCFDSHNIPWCFLNSSITHPISSFLHPSSLLLSLSFSPSLNRDF